MQTAQSSGDVPAHDGANAQPVTDETKQGNLITIDSDVLALKVDTLGGDVISAKLLKYDAELDSKQPFVLLQDKPGHVYIAQSGLIGPNGIDTAEGRAQFKVDGTSFKMAEGRMNCVYR